MNAIATHPPRRENRLTRLGLLTEPAGYVDGVNLFEYVGGNPVTKADPLGLQTTTSQPAVPVTVADLQAEFARAKDIETKLNVAIAGANAAFAPCKIKIQLARFEDLTRNPDVGQVFEAVNKQPDLVSQLALLTRLTAIIAQQNKANLGVLITDLTVFGFAEGGFSAADPAKAKRENDIKTVQGGGWIGDIILSSANMTSLTLAQEIRDRLAHEDNDQKGNKLRNGKTADIIKDFPNAKLASLCDDECARLRTGLKTLGFINEDPVDGKEYTITIYGAHLGLRGGGR